MYVYAFAAGLALDVLTLTLGWKARHTMYAFIKRNRAALIAAGVGALIALIVVQVIVLAATLHWDSL